MKKTQKKNAGKKATKLVTKCDKLEEPVTNSCLASDQRSSGDQSKEVVANCNNLEETTLNQYDIEKLIVMVRGEQVLIDQDIARIYGVKQGALMNKPSAILQGSLNLSVFN